MKIAFLVDNFPAISETFILNQITGLLDLGHEVEIFARKNFTGNILHPDIEKYSLMDRVTYTGNFIFPNSVIKRIGKALYHVIPNIFKEPLPLLRALTLYNTFSHEEFLALFFKVLPYLRENFNIVQCHYGANGNIGALLKKIGVKAEVVTMFHGYDIREGIERGGEIYNELFHFGDCFLSISEYNYTHLVRFGAPPEKIIFHPVGVDLRKFTYKWTTQISPEREKIKIITVARLVKEKGLHGGIKSIQKLKNLNPNIKFEYQIVGGGPLESDLKNLIDELGLTDIVTLSGPMEQEEVIDALNNSDIFLLPSISEALPVVLLEAQAIGLPVVATSVGSVSDTMIENKSGFLVPSGDSDGMAEKLDMISRNPDQMSQMGRAGRKYIEDNYDIAKLNKKLVDIYKNLIEGK